MATLIGRCGGGASSVTDWAVIGRTYGNVSPLTVVSYPDASYDQDVDWTGGLLRTADPTLFSWSNANPTQLAFTMPSTAYAFHAESIVTVNTQIGAGSDPDALQTYILPSQDDLDPSSPTGHGTWQGWRPVYGGAVPRPITEGHYGASRTGAFTIIGSQHFLLDLVNSQGPTVPVTVAVVSAQLRVVVWPITGNDITTSPLA